MLVVEGGAVGAAAVRIARKRPRRSRVRREPIDVELLKAELAEARSPAPARPLVEPREIIAALEAKVQQVKAVVDDTPYTSSRAR